MTQRSSHLYLRASLYHQARQFARDVLTPFSSISNCHDRTRIATLTSLLVCACAIAVQNIEANEVNTTSAQCALNGGSADSNQMIISGKVLGVTGATTNAILIERDTIQQIGKIDEIRSIAPDARLLTCENVYISPGLINAHEHPPYSGGKPGPNVKPVYTNRYQWQGRGGDQYAEVAYSRVETEAELYWIELRHLLAGTTTFAGNGAVPGLIKNVGTGDQEEGFVYPADMKTFPFPNAISDFAEFPWPYTGPSVKPELTEGAPLDIPYVPHVAEGTDKISKLEAEFFLDYVASNPGRRYAMIHAVGLSRDSVTRLRELDVTIVWSPRSNLALYGDTIDLPHLIENGARVALSTDWSYSGSYNLLESFKCAKHVDRERWGNELSAMDLSLMVTRYPAYALNLERNIGEIKAGFAADLVMVRARSDDGYADLVESKVSDIVASIVDGKLVSGHRDAFESNDLPDNCSNFVGNHFVCDDLSNRDFTWQQLLEINRSAIPLFEPDGQANCVL